MIIIIAMFFTTIVHTSFNIEDIRLRTHSEAVSKVFLERK
jgi:hypothetical protein